MDWSWKFAADITPALLLGLKTTVIVTIVSYGLALVFGLVFALGKMSPVAAVRRPVELLNEGIRRTPLLVQLYFLFYVLPGVGILLPALAAGIIGLALHNATYISEVYRAGINNVPAGQWEAATACNLTRWQIWKNVILPQAVPPMIPPLGNYIIAMFKETALLAAIGVYEFLGAAMSEADYNYRYLEPITMVAVGFLVLSLLSAAVIKFFERRLKLVPN